MKWLWKPWRILHGKRTPSTSNKPQRARLSLEILEDRLALSGVSPALEPDDPVAHALWGEQRYTIDDAQLIRAVGSPYKITSPLQASNVLISDSRMASLINLDRVFSEYPYRGAGYSVAIIDTGIDYNHADLGGGWGRRVIAGYDFVNNDADPMDDNGHGTHVAGIVGGSNASYIGVAPGVNFIALKVLDSSGSGSFADIEEALNWVIAHQAQYNIVAINMSLGTGNFSTNPYTFLESEFQTLKDQGVFIAAASGNSFYAYSSTAGLGYPAISTRTVSVGAVWDGNFGQVTWGDGARDYTTAADRITSFTQRSSYLDILAPGALITSTYLNNSYRTMAGTSMATPVVAGAAALLHQALDAAGQGAQANQDTILNLMQTSGVSIYDGDDENDNVTNTGLTFKRLNIHAALGAIAPVTPSVSAVADQSVARQAGSATFNFTVSNATSVSASAKTLPRAAYDLDQQHGFFYAGGNYYQNAHGANEKHFLGTGNVIFFIKPDGTLYRWGGSIESSTLIARLDSSYWANPTLLLEAVNPGTSPALSTSLTNSGNNYQLTVGNFSGVTGVVTVTITASNGSASASRFVHLTMNNSAPTLSGLNDQTMSPAGGVINFTAGDDTPLNAGNFNVTVKTLAQTGYDLDQQHGFFYAGGNYYQNAHGANEKHFLGAGNVIFFIKPDGSLFRWGGSIAASTFMARLDASYWADPSLLLEPANPALAQTAYNLDQSLGLFTQDGNYYQNAHGANEKHFLGTGNTIYFIKPDGNLFRWGGSIAASTFVASLDSSYWANPARLHDAVNPGPALNVSAYITGSGANYQLNFGSFGAFSGVAVVTVTANDGTAATSRTFQVTINNQAPVLTGLDSDRTATSAGTAIAFSASDPDGALTTSNLTVTVKTAAQIAYELDRQLGLFYAGGNYYQNAHGANEKHFLGTGNVIYFIQPDGGLYRWGGSIAASTLIARLDSTYWADPRLLLDAVAPTSAISSSISGGGTNYLLNLSNFGGYRGTLIVSVTANDGVAATTKTFQVRVS